ncbi:MAG TPA: heme biosynthesis protein, partial [Nitrospiraceae bacterium]|nr:heme biosynthesis protein [Nitrospiraceae bacterium]
MGKSLPLLNFSQLAGTLDSLEQQVKRFVMPGAFAVPNDGRTVDDFKPFLVALNLTKRCNLKCAHCYLDATTKAGGGSDELTTGE